MHKAGLGPLHSLSCLFYQGGWAPRSMALNIPLPPYAHTYRTTGLGSKASPPQDCHLEEVLYQPSRTVSLDSQGHPCPEGTHSPVEERKGWAESLLSQLADLCAPSAHPGSFPISDAPQNGGVLSGGRGRGVGLQTQLCFLLKTPLTPWMCVCPLPV